MGSRGQLERTLATLSGFEDPHLALEQYPTPADLAATLVHDAALRGDLEGTVLDLGTGTGILAIGAALRSPNRVLGVDRDRSALEVAVANETAVDPPMSVDWLAADASRLPICIDDATVVMNPPFGAQDGHRHTDRRFLEVTAEVAAVSYSIHNRESVAFVESFVSDVGGEVTHAFEAQLSLDRQFDHHTADRETIAVDVFRVEWA